MGFLTFNGRITRTTWWLGFVAIFVALCVLILYLSIFSLGGEGAFAALIYLLIVLSAKRIHDIGYPAWVAFVFLIPGVGMLFLIAICGFVHGTGGTNQYGPDPLA